MIFPSIIEYKSGAYDEMVALRHKILRAPLGLTFSEEDLERDAKDILLVLSAPRPPRIVACCILSLVDERRVKLRQMAVDDTIQNSGLGTSMLAVAEFVAQKEGFEVITLHARKLAVGFYEKYGYKIIGEEFQEVGIPHNEMEKIIERP
ncbi:MAG: GNAT family N-acetyltransferase [Dysgonomonas sp.]|nr:GNAT family N-acetyltransferase [Dysgonomonas sp.]